MKPTETRCANPSCGCHNLNVRKEPAPEERLYCLHCGEKYSYVVGDEDGATLAAALMLEHDSVCEENPIRQELLHYVDLLNEADREIDRLNTTNKWYQRVLGMAVMSGILAHYIPVGDLVLVVLIALGGWWLLQRGFDLLIKHFWSNQ